MAEPGRRTSRRRAPVPRGGYDDVYEAKQENAKRWSVPPIGGSIELLDIGRDTVVVVRGEQWDEESFAALRVALRADVLLLHLPAGESLEALDTDAMRAAGWVRADAQNPESENP